MFVKVCEGVCVWVCVCVCVCVYACVSEVYKTKRQPEARPRITFMKVESHNAMLRVAGSLGRSTEIFRKSLEPAAPGPPVMSSH